MYIYKFIHKWKLNIDHCDLNELATYCMYKTYKSSQ